MKVFKLRCLKSYNAIIAFLISFLGFNSSCEIGGKVMYGTPSADFIVNGKIESKVDHAKIPGIKVELIKEYNSDGATYSYRLDSAFSAGTDGTYQVAAREFPDDQTFKIHFTDVDGAQNGEFEPLDTTVVFENPKFTNGSGSWYEGETSQVFDVKLRPKQ